MSGLTDQIDIDMDQPPFNTKSKKKRPKRNLLPRLNQSVIVPSSAIQQHDHSNERESSAPRKRLMQSAAKAKPKRPVRQPVKDDESNLSSSLLRKLATDSEREKKAAGGRYAGAGGFDS